jgi:hypothetical protein
VRSKPFACLCTVAALLFSGCTARELPPSSVGAARKIGVVSALGDDIYFARSGVTVFGNASSRGAVPEWKLDELLLERIRADLSPGREIATQVLSPPNAVRLAGLPPFDSTFRAAPLPEPADLWLVVSSKCASAGNYAGPVPCGIAISRLETIFTSPRAWIVLQGQIAVYDGATRKLIAQSDILLDRQCGPFANGSLFDLGRSGCEPGIELGRDFAVDRWQDYTETQRESIHRQLLQFLEPSIDFTLRRLKLLN